MKSGLVADTGGLLRALACRQDGTPAWPDYTAALTQASAIIVPALVLAEIDYFLRQERPAMRKLIAEILDPGTTYELEAVIPTDLVRAMEIDAKFASLGLGLVDATVATVAETGPATASKIVSRGTFNLKRYFEPLKTRIKRSAGASTAEIPPPAKSFFPN